MNYPLISEYIESIKAAEDNFEELNYLHPVLDADGLPVMTSGNFAVVFKMKDERDGKQYAVKCFTKEQQGREDAYRLIADELQNVVSPYIVPIKYLEKELFVDSKQTDETEFPVLLMDWVKGKTLDKYLRENLEDQYALEMLAYRFSQLAQWLIPQPFAHGDLKPDNILVREDGTLVLVDYDGMYVPAMKGQKARELGSPDFRHPLRTEDDFDEHIDDFPLVSILLSLKAISLNPQLLEEYGAADRLLFSEKDYRDINKCELLKAIYPSKDHNLNVLLSLFTIAINKLNLLDVSFRLLDLSEPIECRYENLHTNVTEMDFLYAWTDESGVKYSKDGTRLLKAPDDIEKYKIKNDTLVICDNAFINCRKLYYIKLPPTIISIGDCAFQHCAFKEIHLPNSLYHLGGIAFANNEVLTSINFPKKLREISLNNIIGGCNNLQNINIETRFMKMKDGVIYSNDYKIVYSYLYQSNVLTVDLDNRVDYISSNAFWGSKIESVFLPENLKEIGHSAFANCRNLHVINIPSYVKRIEKNTFFGCSSLTSINIPASVIEIGACAIESCTSLVSIVVDSFNSVYDSRNDCNAIIETSSNKLVAGCRNTIIPEGVLEIGDSAFKLCSSLTSINIPEGVLEIGDFAFFWCSSLISINIPKSVTKIGRCAFMDCSSLTSINIPASILKIAHDAFSFCSSLTSIIIPIGSREHFEELLPEYKDKLVEHDKGWTVTETRPFNTEEIESVKNAEVVASKYGNSVCFYMKSGGKSYIPLTSNSTLDVGDAFNLETAKILRLSREGEEDIYRVVE